MVHKEHLYRQADAWAYDRTGNHMERRTVAIGDEVQWKRRGVRGAYRARIVAIKAEKVQLQLLRYSDRPLEDLSTSRPVWVRPIFLRIH